ncbi:MAG: Trm112 family protein [Pseudomonadota bacterium]
MTDLIRNNRSEQRMTLADPKMLELLVCPVTKLPLRYDAAKQELISDKAGLAYPIRDGIPVMLPDAARKIDQ